MRVGRYFHLVKKSGIGGMRSALPFQEENASESKVTASELLKGNLENML